MSECIVEGCGRSDQKLRKGMCVKHYQRNRKYGNPQTLIRIKDFTERFWSYVDKTETCWIWTGYKSALGYGQIYHGEAGRTIGAHRVSYAMVNGPIAEGLVIDHKCHRASCVNPSHLRAVTQKQNVENHSGAQSNSKSGIRGVRQRTRGDWKGRWEGRVHHDGATHYLGFFDTAEQAEAAVIVKRNEFFTCNDIDRMATK